MRYLIILSLLITQNAIAQMDTVSYSVGMVVAKNLKSQGMSELDISSFTQAFEDVFNGVELKLSFNEATEQFQNYMGSLQKAVGEKTKSEGLAFLEENGKRPSVVTLSSGLQYEVITASSDTQKPALYDKVKVHYHGTLINGTVFDSSVERNEPISFPLNGVIQGWQEGLQLMSVGSKYKLYIPYHLAYGERGAGEVIKPYSSLVFEVELLGIE